MSLENDVTKKLQSAPRIRIDSFKRQLPGSPASAAQVLDDTVRTLAVQNEAILMLAREVDKLSSTLGGR